MIESTDMTDDSKVIEAGERGPTGPKVGMDSGVQPSPSQTFDHGGAAILIGFNSVQLEAAFVACECASVPCKSASVC